jgi:hypothetical protein
MSQDAHVRPLSAFTSVINSFINLLLARHKTGAIIRLLLVSTSFIVYWFILIVVMDFPGELPLEWQVRLHPLVYVVVSVLVPFFHPQVLLHLIPVLVAFLTGLFIGALYLSDLFELDSFWIAASYLLGALFGLGSSTLVIDKGDISEFETNSLSNPLLRIGGPGHIIVHLGFAAVFEKEDGLPRVYGPPNTDQETRRTFKEGFERLRNVIDLRDQLGKVDEVLAVTRDGIEVYARDAQMLFRVHGGGQQRSLQNPYPYTDAGIRRLVYGLAVQQEGQLKWEEALPEIVRREIRQFVARHTIEEFLALQPSSLLDEGEAPLEPASQIQEHGATIQIPRRQLTEHFHTEQLRQRLQDQGLDLAWVGVGTWEVRDDQPPSLQDETGPAKTLTATWRDLQRANLYKSTDYQARQHNRGLREYNSDVIQEIIRTWKHGELPKSYRCFEILNSFRHLLGQMLYRLEGEQDLNPPPDIEAVVDHILFLIRSKEIGEEEV